MGDFNAESNNSVDISFGSNTLKNLIKKHTYFKNLDKSTCIELILTNSQKISQNFTLTETGSLRKAYFYCIKKWL